MLDYKMIVVALIVVMIGRVIGLLERKDMQKNLCPYCSCRECCNIGCNVIAACPDNEQKAFVCKTKNN